MGGLGIFLKEETMMFHFIDDKEFLSNLRSTCADIVNQLKQEINRNDVMEVDTYLVGSGARNLITQNGNEPVDLDYQLEVVTLNGFEWNECRKIKEYIRKEYNEILCRNGWSDCSDSTSVLSTEYRYFTKGNNTKFKIDLAIIVKDNKGNWWRLIHKKTGVVNNDEWVWEQGRDSKGLENRVNKLKQNGCWEEVRDAYLTKKNFYLRRNDYDHPSFICYIEAVNEVYSKKFRQ